jgi:hypothetical protein
MPEAPTPSPIDDAAGTDDGPDRLTRGDVVNLLGRLRRRLEDDDAWDRGGQAITDAQNRLMMKRMETTDLLEPAWRPAREQIARLARLVASATALDADDAERRLRACWRAIS